MRIMHISLGGCLSAPPVKYGMTEDTGGHIAYVLGAAMAQAKLSEFEEVTIVTRLFDAPELGAVFAQVEEEIAPKCRVLRLASDRAEGGFNRSSQHPILGGVDDENRQTKIRTFDTEQIKLARKAASLAT